MASASSKTLLDFLQPAKRLKTAASAGDLMSKSSVSSLCMVSTNGVDSSGPQIESPSDLSPEQKKRIEINKFLARSRRNLRICAEKIEKCKGTYMVVVGFQLTRDFQYLGGVFSDVSARWLCASEEGMGYVKLEELLVEETWTDALPGEFQKPYAKNLCRFLEKELQGTVPIYPPQHLIFNALNSTAFDRVKAVIIGQVRPHQFTRLTTSS